MKKKIAFGSRKRDVEEYIQLWNFEQWVRNHPDFKTIGMYGMMGRACSLVKLTDLTRYGTGDKIANMSTAKNIVSKNPYEAPAPPANPAPKPAKKRGRPKKKRGKLAKIQPVPAEEPAKEQPQQEQPVSTKEQLQEERCPLRKTARRGRFYAHGATSAEV